MQPKWRLTGKEANDRLEQPKQADEQADKHSQVKARLATAEQAKEK